MVETLFWKSNGGVRAMVGRQRRVSKTVMGLWSGGINLVSRDSREDHQHWVTPPATNHGRWSSG